MARINRNYEKLPGSYLFSEIARRTAAYQEANPDARLIKMGIGDVTRPLAPAVVAAMHAAVDDLAAAETFHGYGPEQGYAFLRDAIAEHDFAARNITIDPDEIFVSDGAKSDCGNIGDIFSENEDVVVTDPAYPVYVDSNVMGGRTVHYVNSTEDNGFAAMPDESMKPGLIYLCSPNNPTGSVYTKEQLKVWVDYAIKNKSVIIFDAAYEAFISDETLPRSIFQIEGARKCAIEICSLSKTAGFTGTRCGYTVIPEELMLETPTGEEISFMQLWCRRQGSKFNGVSYPVQRAAEAVFTEEGYKQTRATIAYYMQNAKVMSETFDELGIKYTGGKNSPYIWFKCPDGMDSWTFFDKLLNEAEVVGTPGAGFGKNGDGWFRLTAFGTHENTVEAMQRVKKLLSK